MVTDLATVESFDAKLLYAEGCSSLRHYSTCVINTRTVILAQGFVLLTAAIYLITQHRYLQSLTISVFGLLFTLVLHALQGSYWRVFDVVLEVVVQLERAHSNNWPWQAYYDDRAERYKTLTWRALVRHGSISIFTAAFILTTIYGAMVAW